MPLRRMHKTAPFAWELFVIWRMGCAILRKQRAFFESPRKGLRHGRSRRLQRKLIISMNAACSRNGDERTSNCWKSYSCTGALNGTREYTLFVRYFG